MTSMTDKNWEVRQRRLNKQPLFITNDNSAHLVFDLVEVNTVTGDVRERVEMSEPVWFFFGGKDDMPATLLKTMELAQLTLVNHMMQTLSITDLTF